MKIMKRISIDNGNNYIRVTQAVEAIAWDVIVNSMDDTTREAIHNQIAPCDRVEFLTAYLEAADDDLIIG